MIYFNAQTAEGLLMMKVVILLAAIVFPAAASASPEGQYTCVSFLNGMLVTMLQPFTITGSSYTAKDGSQGTIKWDVGTGQIVFAGGSFDGQTARFDGTKINFGQRNSVNCAPMKNKP